MIKHPIQPIVSVNGVERFKKNEVVSYLLDNGGLDLNHLAMQGFDKHEMSHFAQLIGYSVSGWGTLSYVTDEDYHAAQVKKDDPNKNDYDVRLEGLEAENRNLKDIIKSILEITQEINEEHLD